MEQGELVIFAVGMMAGFILWAWWEQALKWARARLARVAPPPKRKPVVRIETTVDLIKKSGLN